MLLEKYAKAFKDKKLAQAYLKKNYDKLMKEKLDKEDEPIVKAVVKMLKKQVTLTLVKQKI